MSKPVILRTIFSPCVADILQWQRFSFCSAALTSRAGEANVPVDSCNVRPQAEKENKIIKIWYTVH